MGQGLHLGIATQISVSTEKLTKEIILRDIGQFFSLDLFNVTEEEDCIEFMIKEDLLEKHLEDFLREQYTLLNIVDDKWEKNLLEKIHGMSSKEIVEYWNSKEQGAGYCFVSDSRISYCNYIFSDDVMWKRPFFQIECFAYHGLYKTYIESGTNDFFTMICKLVRQTSKNPLANLFYIDML